MTVAAAATGRARLLVVRPRREPVRLRTGARSIERRLANLQETCPSVHLLPGNLPNLAIVNGASWTDNLYRDSSCLRHDETQEWCRLATRESEYRSLPLECLLVRGPVRCTLPKNASCSFGSSGVRVKKSPRLRGNRETA